MEANDELSALELTWILQERFHIAVSAQTVRRVRQKLGWRWSGTKYCELVKDVNKRVQHRLNILYNGDIFYDAFYDTTCNYDTVCCLMVVALLNTLSIWWLLDFNRQTSCWHTRWWQFYFGINSPSLLSILDGGSISFKPGPVSTPG